MIPSIKYHLVDSRTVERAQNQGQDSTAAVVCPESFLEPDCLDHFVVLCMFVSWAKALTPFNHAMVIFLANPVYSFQNKRDILSLDTKIIADRINYFFVLIILPLYYHLIFLLPQILFRQTNTQSCSISQNGCTHNILNF